MIAQGAKAPSEVIGGVTAVLLYGLSFWRIAK